MTQITIDTDKLPLKKKLKCGCNILADWSLDHDNTILINIKPKCRRHKEEELKRYYTLTMTRVFIKPMPYKPMPYKPMSSITTK